MATADDTVRGRSSRASSLRPARAPSRGGLAGDEPHRRRAAGRLVLVDAGLPHLDRPFDYIVPGVDGRRRGAGRAGQGALRRAGRRRLRARAPRPPPSTRAAAARCAGWSRPSRCSPRDARPGPRGRRPVRRLARPTCSGSPSRRGTRPPRRPSRSSRRAPAPLPDAVPRPGRPYAGRAGLPGAPRRGRRPARPALALPRGRRRRLAGAARRGRPRPRSQGGRGAVLVVPDHRDVVRVEAALLEVLGPGRHARLTADQGPQARYTAYLKALRGHVAGGRRHPRRGVRAGARPRPGRLLGRRRRPARRAAGALPARARGAARPVARARAPRCCRRAQPLGGRAPSCSSPAGWAHRRRGPPRGAASRPRRRCGSAGDGHDARPRPGRAAAARCPPSPGAPRRRHSPPGRCWCRCRAAATCRRWPATTAAARPAARCAPGRWRCPGRRVRRPAAGAAGSTTGCACPACGGHRLRASVVGARRTAEELGRAFPGVPVERSGAATVLADRAGRAARSSSPRPGAEPVAPGGYAAALLLDAWALLDAARPRRGRGGAAPLAGGGGTGAAGIRRGPGRARRRPDRGAIPAVEALRALGPGLVRRARARRAARAVASPGLPAGGAHRRPAGPRGGDRRARAAGARRPCSARCPHGAPTAWRTLVTRRRGPTARALAARARPATRARASRAQGPRPGVGARRPAGPHGVTVRRRHAAPTTPGRERHVRPSACSATRSCAPPPSPVVDFDKELRASSATSPTPCWMPPGAGLAAPQLGVGLRVFTY